MDVETKGEFTRGMTVCDWRDFMGTDPEQEISREKCWNKYKTSGNVEVARNLTRSGSGKCCL